jgi:hypothetical protein
MAAVKYTVDVQITGGPKLNFNEAFDAEGYDRIEVLLPSNKTDTPVAIQPGDAADIQLLIIRVNKPHEKVIIENGQTDVKLTGPLILTGPSMNLLANVKDITFNNDSGEDVTVTILVARKAI